MMITKTHIASFVGLTILAWIIALWVQGLSVMSWDFLRPFSIVVAIVSVIASWFNQWAWSWSVFRGWYVKRPDLRGTWKVMLESDWIEPETGQKIDLIDGYIVIRQTLSSLTLRLLTKESRSQSIAYNITIDDDKLYRLAIVYRNEPNIDLRGEKSEIHHGAFWVEVLGDGPREMVGHYWTDRETSGKIHCNSRIRQYFYSYDEANSFYKEQSIKQ